MYTSNIDVLANNYSDSLPKTYNFLRPNAFKFSVKDLPNTSFTCQSANLPQLALGFASQPTPFVDIPRIGDKLEFGEFTIRFIIAEDMSNYLELYRWLVAIGFPKDYSQFGQYVKNRPSSFPMIKNSKGEQELLAYSDGTLTILDSTNTPKVNIIYKDIFPVSLEALDFDIASASVEYFTAIASFKYTLFEVEQL
tara:strand:+ start:962 stop:1546 length:585 start_codon:yes stop_codon:yes gene_type:complete